MTETGVMKDLSPALLYPTTRIEVTCVRCGQPFRKPSWAVDDGKDACNTCAHIGTVYLDEADPIISFSGVELVAQRWGGDCYVGTRWYRDGRTVADHPQDTDLERDDPDAGVQHNHVVMLSEDEVRTYAHRLLALIGEDAS